MHSLHGRIIEFFLITLAASLSAWPGPAGAAEPASVGAAFIVDSLGDGASASDADPGDGVCSSGAGTCTLRAAIEESNALPGVNDILFSVTGTILVGNHLSGNALPAITDPVRIFGPFEEIGGVARPEIVLDGSQLSSSPGIDGLRLTSGAAGSEIRRLALVHFTGHGIEVVAASGLLVDGCFVGLQRDGAAAGNGGDGINALTNQSVFGRQLADGAIEGEGNVIGDNAGDGAFVFGGDNVLAGNRIGTGPLGTTERGNAAGLVIAGNGNRVGLDEASNGGNVIAGNDGVGLRLSGTGGTVVGNRVGVGADGSAIGNGGIGIEVLGDDHVVGAASTHGANAISGNAVGISLGSVDTSADGTLVENNSIGFGVGASAFGNAGDGLVVVAGADNRIEGNLVTHSGAHGIRNGTGAIDSVFRSNWIGVFETGSDVFNLGNAQFGIINEGTALIGGEGGGVGNRIGFNHTGIVLEHGQAEVHGNLIGITPAGEMAGNIFSGVFINEDSDSNSIGTFSAGNQIGHHGGHGIESYSDGNSIRHNYIGTNPAREYRANGGFGVLVGGSAADNILSSNTIRFNDDGGVAVLDFANAISIQVNEIFDNGGIGIDLSGEGITENDPGDGDIGPNGLMNFPEIQGVEADSASSNLSIELLVDATAANAAYPLVIDFYANPPGHSEREGMVWLGTVTYETPQSVQSFNLPVPSEVVAGALVAKAIDDDGDTSEYSAPVDFARDRIFRDRFESAP